MVKAKAKMITAAEGDPRPEWSASTGSGSDFLIMMKLRDRF